MNFTALIIGANSAIAQAITERYIQQTDCERVFTVSRHPASFTGRKVTQLLTDYSEHSIAEICSTLLPFAKTITRLIICNGTLHDNYFMPEKKVADINAAQLAKTYHINTIIPMLWLSHLAPILEQGQIVKIAVFSARVGSISDNRMGGWYSYRASKAALNMLIQCSSIEYARRAPNVKLIAFHPGTTDTPLSKPFQRAVAKNKLFTPAFVAKKLLSILDQSEVNQKAAYLDWNNDPITW